MTQTPDRLVAAFQAGTLQDRWGYPLTIRTTSIGHLTIVSGAVVACDAILAAGTVTAFTTPVPVGAHPVLLRVATHVNGAQSVACAMIRFADAMAVRWELATSAGQDPATLEPGEVWGYSVDSGTGCFMDAALAHRVPAGDPGDLSSDPSSKERNYEPLSDEAEARMATIVDALQRSTHPRWANVVLDSTTGANIVAFDSGYGDGIYASFFGYDAQDRPVCLITDFEVLPT